MFGLLIPHVKPGFVDETLQELQRVAESHVPAILAKGDIYWI
ncbi:hypothetical protein [Paraburkholderia sp. HP33-1]|nr:hypothetical protein [Paraburkholderia sp. HP33-1]